MAGTCDYAYRLFTVGLDMAVSFQVSTRWTGRKRTLKVVVYDTARELREAGIKHNWQHEPVEIKDLNNTWGLVQTYDRYHITTGGRTIRHPDLGYMRLVKGHTTSGIIAHECTHVAIAAYKQDVQKTIPDMEREEILCYLVGDFMSKIVRKLYAYDLIQ